MRQEALERFAVAGGDTLRLGSCTFTASEEVEIEVVRYRVVRDAQGREKARHRVSSAEWKAPSKEHA